MRSNKANNDLFDVIRYHSGNLLGFFRLFIFSPWVGATSAALILSLDKKKQILSYCVYIRLEV